VIVSNSRRLRHRHKAGRSEARERARRAQALPRFPNKDPALSTVRGWLRQLETEGRVERKGAERTGKPGRPAVLWGVTEAATEDPPPPAPEPLTRDRARKFLHEACREELGISGRQFVRQLDAGAYECGWKCRCATPHQPGLRALLRAAAWSRMSVLNASRDEPAPIRRRAASASSR